MNFEQIRQAQALVKMQKELKKMQVEGEAGKGAVTVVINGEQKIVSVKISPEIVDPKNTKQLEQLIIKAVNDAQDKIQKAAVEQMKAGGRSEDTRLNSSHEIPSRMPSSA